MRIGWSGFGTSIEQAGAEFRVNAGATPPLCRRPLTGPNRSATAAEHVAVVERPSAPRRAVAGRSR